MCMDKSGTFQAWVSAVDADGIECVSHRKDRRDLTHSFNLWLCQICPSILSVISQMQHTSRVQYSPPELWTLVGTLKTRQPQMIRLANLASQSTLVCTEGWNTFQALPQFRRVSS